MGGRRERTLKRAGCWQLAGTHSEVGGQAKPGHLNLGNVALWALFLTFAPLPTPSPPGCSLSSVRIGGIGLHSHAAACTPGELRSSSSAVGSAGETPFVWKRDGAWSSCRNPGDKMHATCILPTLTRCILLQC